MVTTLFSQSSPGPADSKNLSMRGHSMFENRELSSLRGEITLQDGKGRPVAAILACTLLSSLTWTYCRGRSRTKRRVPHVVEEVSEGRLLTKGRFWKVVCDLYAETGVSIERT